MRPVAALLLVLCATASLRAPTDRVHPAHAVRSTSRHFLLLTISESGRPSPASPSRREPALESAFDEEETIDLDPLGAHPRGVATDPSASPHPERSASLAPSPSPLSPRRPGTLRC